MPSIVNVTMSYVIDDVMKIQTGDRMTSRQSVPCRAVIYQPIND